MCAHAVHIYSLNRLQTLLKAKLITYKDYLWNLFSPCRNNQSFTHSLGNIKKLLSPGDPSVLTLLSSSSLQIASGFHLAVSEKFQSPFQFFRSKPESRASHLRPVQTSVPLPRGRQGCECHLSAALHPVPADGRSDRCRLSVHWVILQITLCRYTLP